MHALIVSQQWFPESGIAQRRMDWIVRGLRNAGHTVAVVTAPPHYPTGHLLSSDRQYAPHSTSTGPHGESIWRTTFREHGPGLRSRIIDQGVIAASSLRVLPAVMTEQRPDLVIATAPPLPSIAVAWAAATRMRIPYIVDLRDAWPDLVHYVVVADSFGSKAPLRRRIAAHGLLPPAAMLGRMLRGASGIVTTTASFASEVERRWRRPTHTLTNLPLAPLHDLLAPPPARDRLEVLYAGTIGRAQGLHSALEALAICQRRGVPVHLTMVGVGAHAPSLRRSAESRGLGVSFASHANSDELLRAYQAADTLLVHLQDWKPLELTVPSKLYEVIRSGRHVSLAANGEARTILEASGAGDGVPAMDPAALAQLWEDLHKDRSRLNVGSRGRDWADSQPGADEEIASFLDFVDGIAQ